MVCESSMPGTLTVQLNAVPYDVRLTSALDLSIPIYFDAPQVNHFNAPAATAKPLIVGDYVGSTKQGGSCNADYLSLIPHCNGTHTECLGHIVDEKISVHEVLKHELCLAKVITVQTELGRESQDRYRPKKCPEDLIISKAALSEQLTRQTTQREGAKTKGCGEPNPTLNSAFKALVIRTTPNPRSKITRHYTATTPPAYFSTEALQFLATLEITHLLVDLPSLDRMYDDGLLSNHHQWWHIPQRKKPGDVTAPNADAKRHRTITELIYVEDSIADGDYLLNLQIPALQGDAVPSRPLLYPLSKHLVQAPSSPPPPAQTQTTIQTLSK